MGGNLKKKTRFFFWDDVKVDVEGVDAQRFPLFAGAPWLECVLEAGSVLYLPPRWWHYVRSLSLSFSVSFWWK